MRKVGAVSLWAGNAASAETLDEYMETKHTEDGDIIPSQFALDFKTGEYEDDFREASSKDRVKYLKADPK